MASTSTSITETVRVQTRRYRWPAVQLNFWLLIMMVASATVLGVFANFMTIQTQLGYGIPWQFPYWVTTGAISVAFLLLLMWLISRQMLLPGLVFTGCFILFVLWLVGLIVTSIELWGPVGNVNALCGQYITGNPITGPGVDTLAWLQQSSICSSWKAAFAFELVGMVFLLWMAIISLQVFQDH